MNKNKKNRFKDITTPAFIIGSVLLVGIMVGSIIYSYFLPNQSDDLKSLEYLVKSLAAGPEVPYGDPLIIDDILRYPKVLLDDPRLGSKQALVTIFVFNDFNCEPCRPQHEVLNNIVNEYPDNEVRLVWKGVASTPVGMLAQQAAFCSHAQGEFWSYADILFANQSNLGRQFYTEVANSLDLDVDEFAACLDEAQMQDKVYNNNIDATDLGIKSVPYFFIDNTPYEGVLSEVQLEAIIALLLRK